MIVSLPMALAIVVLLANQARSNHQENLKYESISRILAILRKYDVPNG